MNWPGGARTIRLVVVLALMALAASGCIINANEAGTGPIDADSVNGPTPAATAVDTQPQFEPTAPPTATAVPEPTPTATPEPTPTPVPPPVATPRPVQEASEEPVTVAAGSFSTNVPVRGQTSFELTTELAILQLSGHTLMYLDATRTAEVDLFSPVASANGGQLITYDDVLNEFESIFPDLTELDSTTVAGSPARVFEGRPPVQGDRGFHTDLALRGEDLTGWFTPGIVKIWLIDSPSGVLAISAESIDDDANFAQAKTLAAEVIETLTIRSR